MRMNFLLTTKTTKASNMMTVLKMVGAALLAVSVTACVTQDDYYNSDQYKKPAAPPKYDVAPQVIYNIDGNRFISLENYDQCYGDTYYNNLKENIHTKLGRGGIEYYRGRLIIDDPSGSNVVIPSARPGPCGNKGCDSSLIYSTDGGRTFKGKVYMNGQTPSVDSENYSILVAKNDFYVVETSEYAKGKFNSYVRRYPLFPGLDFDNRSPYPEGISGETFSTSKKPLPNLRTPSGQDRFICDTSIRPSNLPKKK
ncbi:hypothetical protein [Herbaspirillum sp. RV1423]|uniref:T6SS immunity protein Tli3 family protein n=1 Tax=Herbaspirillum sp. RV1423 TaxID=1443993 RepID=UPI0012DFB9C9|nr:hypothetical protein [Herbaspirillum sp. RV1423]